MAVQTQSGLARRFPHQKVPQTQPPVVRVDDEALFRRFHLYLGRDGCEHILLNPVVGFPAAYECTAMGATPFLVRE
eukprot:3253437-Prymnesium_polylepis.1